MDSTQMAELLVPAGSIQKMKYAFHYGADAVYAGIPRFSLRARENDFTEEVLVEAIDYAHQLDKKIYLTMNIFPHNRKVQSFEEMLSRVAGLNADGLIMADPGMISVARERHPELEIHLSTQSNTINWQSVKFWKDLGLKRIILSRELSIDEIKEIKQRVPEIELETFIHGAICIAYSGRCLLSNYFTHRDANQGTCTNACRWEYNVYSEDRQHFIEETERPGSFMPVDEDEHGTYIMNAKDLSTIDILDQLVDAGIDSLKVEGRTKSVYYLSVVTRAYRQALDAVQKNQTVSEKLQDEVYAVANRGYVSGFLERNPLEQGQNYKQSHSDNQTRKFVGLIKKWDNATAHGLIEVRNRFEIGDQLEIMNGSRTIPFEVKSLRSQDGENLQIVHGGGQDAWIELPERPDQYALLRKVVPVEVKTNATLEFSTK